MICTDGRWTSVEDGPCDGRAQCRVAGVDYPSGAKRVPTPYSGCNDCDCDNGALVNCTNRKCTDRPCPAGTFAARKCLDCGPTDACSKLETGCFSEADCEDGICSAVQCG
jgi:hypothetical protein